MGNYNPHLPIILGEEWVPIRNEDLIFAPTVNVVEKGHGFTLNAATQVGEGRFYNHEFPAYTGGSQTLLFGVYPRGSEAETGPIQEVLIPCNAGAVTGTNITVQGGTVASALLTPGVLGVRFDFSGGLQDMSMFFATNQYTMLQGKRILGVSVVYEGWAKHFNATTGINEPFVDADPTTPATLLTMRNDAASQIVTYQNSFLANTGSLDLNTTPDPISNFMEPGMSIAEINLGDLFHFWSVALGPSGTTDRMPWRFADLQRLEATAANRLHLHLTAQVPQTDDSVFIDYAALKVTYCEERRVAYGGRQSFYAPIGMNTIPIRDINNNPTPVLPNGNYTVTLSVVSPGDIQFGLGLTADFPKLNALRELYDIPTHPGVQVNVPFPLHDHLGETFTQELTHILPQLSLHLTGSGPVNDLHAYGRQVAAPVYGAVTAIQDIDDSSFSGAAANFPQVRFYARRFGDTTVPLSFFRSSTPAQLVQVTPAELDALPEILDGWREVTKRFTTVPSFSGTNPSFTWSATGEQIGNRWEVLGASAPAISGIAGNLWNLVPSTQRLGSATYGGTADQLNWQSAPPASGTGVDPASDATVLFTQDPIPVTGVTVLTLTQTLTEIGLDCGTPPCCIPTGISYNRITWPLPAGMNVALDTFSRVVVSGLGSADLGGAYNLQGGFSADYAVNGSQAVITPTTAGSRRFGTLSLGTAVDEDLYIEVTVPNAIVPTSSAQLDLIARFNDTNNHYIGGISIADTGAVTARIQERVGGVTTTLVSLVLQLIGGSGATLSLRFVTFGTYLKLKVWHTGDVEPTSWTLEVTDTSFAAGGGIVGFQAQSPTATGNTFILDNFKVLPPSYWFGALELQRWDQVTDWQTIMFASSPAITGFNDYEARVGLTSQYRLRNVNLYNFAGPWSATGSGTPTAPGVLGCHVNGGVLIFTTNEDQTGNSNLAYAPVWEGSVEETFDFPEAGRVVYQSMYQRDGSVAFHGTERGLERFARSILVQKAAIAPIRLANLRSLRDLAWNELNYVCVRDDVSDRWFSSVLVPGESVHRRRRYNAIVEVTEVTTVPTPVDP